MTHTQTQVKFKSSESSELAQILVQAPSLRAELRAALYELVFMSAAGLDQHLDEYIHLTTLALDKGVQVKALHYFLVLLRNHKNFLPLFPHTTPPTSEVRDLCIVLIQEREVELKLKLLRHLGIFKVIWPELYDEAMNVLLPA